MAIPQNSSNSSLLLSIRSNSPIQFSHTVHTKLDIENFLLWRSQILPVLKGHGLVSFVDGSKSPPDQFIATTDGSCILNPEFESWNQQDQLILAWLFSSISTSILSQIVRCETSAATWSAINHLHSSQSMAKVLDLKLQLQTMKKGNLTCAQFLQQMQLLADRLRSIGTDVPGQDLVLFTAQGLGFDYENFVTALSM